MSGTSIQANQYTLAADINAGRLIQKPVMHGIR
jgi:hypothetical protein